LYWVIVGVLLVGLLGMSVALFYVLDQMKRHKQQNQPTETTVKESVSDNSTTTTTPSGSLPQRTANP
jgi:hypothetical protein